MEGASLRGVQGKTSSLQQSEKGSSQGDQSLRKLSAAAGASLCAGRVVRGCGYPRYHLRKWKDVVFKHYGAVCKCCGKTTFDFLAVDLINGGGNKHRRRRRWVCPHERSA